MVTVIVLTFNEELHIARCLESVADLKTRLVIVDSGSRDDTVAIANSFGAQVFQNSFFSQAQQFNWAMENCDIRSDWVLRLDADEVIDKELSRNIAEFVKLDGYGYSGAVFHRKHIFLGKWIRFGGRYPLPMLRLFKRGFAHVEPRWMDEHIVLDKGSSIVLKGGFEDNNLNNVSWFIDKHNHYATREIVDIYLKLFFSESNSKISKSTSFSIKFKRFLKQELYLKLPFFVRPCLYFFYRYVVQLGFLDGSRGFAYHYMQGFWYRCLVDLKCVEFEDICSNLDDLSSRLSALENYSGYDLSKYRHLV